MQTKTPQQKGVFFEPMTPEQIEAIEYQMAENRLKSLLSDVGQFVRQLEKYLENPASCPSELIPYVEAFRLLRGNREDVNVFFRVVMDLSDPRQEIFKFVLDACEAYNVTRAIRGLFVLS